MPAQPESDDKRPPPLLLSFTGLAIALGLAVWAGNHYMTRDASLLYGLVAGLSFGAAFAFGQQIKNRISPPVKRSSDWRVAAPGAAALSPAKLAAQAARKISVEFDDAEIRTMVRGVKREGIAWEAVDDVSIRIIDGPLPQPEWIIAGKNDEVIKGVLIPNDAEGLDVLMDAMKQRLSGYDNDQTYQTVLSAMSSMTGTFHVWQRQTT